MAAETIQERVEVGGSRQHFATLRPEAPTTFKGKPVELEDWLEAVHIYLALYGQTDDRIMYMVVCQFLSADVKTWVIGSTYRLPCIDIPDIDMPRLSSTCRFYISICHVFHCHVTHSTIRDGTVTPRILLPCHPHHNM